MKRILLISTICALAICDYTTIWEGDWGTWNNTIDARKGYYACGASLRVESDQGSKKDDTAANGLKLKYCSSEDWTKSSWVTIEEGSYGDWSSSECSQDYFINGAQVRYESPQDDEDDTALNGLKITCKNVDTLLS